MPTKPIRRATAVAGGVAALIAGTATGPALAAGQPARHRPPVSHVLLISVDGLHQQDLDWYVRTHPGSVLARLERHGLEYSRARTPFPSDSFPGLVGQVTGGDPGVTGVYYDDTFSHGVFPPGTTSAPARYPAARSTTTRATTSARPPWTPARAWPGCRAASCR
jgi:hypothetical protein